MALLRSLIERRGSVLENPNRPLTDATLSEMFNGPPSASGIRVTQESALGITAVYAAVTLIAGTAASLPLQVWSNRPDGKKVALRTPGNQVLWGRPNPSMTRQVFWETVFGCLSLWGNAYFWKIKEGSGAVAQLWPIRPRTITITHVDKMTGEKTFEVQGEPRSYSQSDIMHIPAFSLDGIYGLSPIGLARQAIGLTAAAEEFGARFFGQGSQLSGVLSVQGTLTEPQSKRLAVQWDRQHAGMQNSHRPAILDNGATWQNIGIPPEDAQFLQTRQFQVAEIARLFRVPPHLIGDVSGSTSWGTGIAEQNAGFHRYTLIPLLARAEQAISDDPDLLATNQTASFDPSGLLRADLLTRYKAYLLARNGGWESPNDIRAFEGEDRIEGLDDYSPPAKITAKEDVADVGLDGDGGNGGSA